MRAGGRHLARTIAAPALHAGEHDRGADRGGQGHLGQAATGQVDSRRAASLDSRAAPVHRGASGVPARLVAR